MGHVYLVCAQTKFCVNLDVQDNWFKIDKKFEEKVGKAVFCWQIAVFMAGQNIHLTLYSWVMHGIAHWTCSQASFWESCAVYRRTSRKWTSPRFPGPTVLCKGQGEEDILSEGSFRLCIWSSNPLHSHLWLLLCWCLRVEDVTALDLWVLTPKLSC